MGKNPAQLNQKQVDVLQWIRDGCPDGIYTDGYEHRIVARALQRSRPGRDQRPRRDMDGIRSPK